MVYLLFGIILVVLYVLFMWVKNIFLYFNFKINVLFYLVFREKNKNIEEIECFHPEEDDSDFLKAKFGSQGLLRKEIEEELKGAIDYVLSEDFTYKDTINALKSCTRLKFLETYDDISKIFNAVEIEKRFYKKFKIKK